MDPLKIEYLPFTKLVPSPNNSRSHSPEQIAQIAASIKEFGFNVPVAIDENNNIIAGEGRYLAIRSMPAYKHKVPTIRLKHLTEAQQRAYIIADNQIALNSTWDEKKLYKEIGQLMNANFDLGTLGFSDDELSDLLKSVPTVEGLTAVSSHTRKQATEKEPSEGKGKTRRLAVLVFCKDATDQLEVYAQLTDQGFECQNAVI